MKTRAILCISVLFAVGLLMAQGNPGSQNAKGDVTVRGCVVMSGGHYVLVQTDPGSTYQLESGSSAVGLDQHLGDQVEVTGWESASLSTTSDLATPGTPSAVTLSVTSIRTLSERCSGEIGASSVAVPKP